MGKYEIVLAAHDRGPKRRRLHAVPSEPVTEVQVVDGIVGVAIAAQTVHGYPTQHASDQINQVVEPGPRQSAGLAGSRACDAEEWQDSGGVAGVAAQRGGDVAVAVGPEDADGEVAQAGHGSGGGAGADLGGVLGEGGVADVVQRLDAPVAPDPVSQAGGVGLGGGEVGDRVDGDGAPAWAV